MKTLFIDRNKPDLSPKKSVLSLGGFDGIHLGHQALLKRLLFLAKEKKAPSCLCVFDPLPFQVLKNHKTFNRLFTIEEMEESLKPFALDFFCIIPFDLSFSKLRAKEFISFMVQHFDPVQILAGYDFSFAYQREGDFSVLKKLSPSFGFSVEQAEAYLYKNQPVSSSRIRKALSLKDMAEFKALLGRAYSLSGKVCKGEGRGQKLGFPTANLSLKNKELPPLGVYGGRAKIGDSWFKAVINIGCRPSFPSTNPAVLVEVHLPSINPDLYGQFLKVELDFFIREEKAFSQISDLKEAIEQDILSLHKQS